LTKNSSSAETNDRMNRVLLAADSSSLLQVTEWADGFFPGLGGIKLGYEFYYSQGKEQAEKIARKVHQRGGHVFLDLKLYDIPNTMVGATKALRHFPADWITCHLSSGKEALRVIEEARQEADMPWRWVGVSVLTSFSEQSYADWQGSSQQTTDLVSRWIETALHSGINSFVCSPVELSVLAFRFPEASWIVPGVRLPGDSAGDQSRVQTPAEAFQNGADWIVMGRSLTNRTLESAKSDLRENLALRT
jgi:orotidine-5'-phosphate decarboxylase